MVVPRLGMGGGGRRWLVDELHLLLPLALPPSLWQASVWPGPCWAAMGAPMVVKVRISCTHALHANHVASVAPYTRCSECRSIYIYIYIYKSAVSLSFKNKSCIDVLNLMFVNGEIDGLTNSEPTRSPFFSVQSCV